MRSIAVTVALLLSSSLASAQPGLTPAQESDDEQPTARSATPAPAPVAAPTYAPMPAPTYIYEVRPYGVYPAAPMPLPAPTMPASKSEGTATLLSLGTTAAGFALLAGAGDEDNAGGMITLGLLAMIIGPSAGHLYAGETGRAVGMSLVRGGAFLAFLAGVVGATSSHGGDCIDWCESNDRSDGEALLWIGGLTFVAATVYDIIDAPRAARRRNAKDRQLMMQPMYVQSASGGSPGIGVSGRF